MEKLAEYLLTNGLVSQEQLEQALEEQKRSHKELGEILLDMGFVSPQDVGKAWETETGVPYISLVDSEVAPMVAQMLPEQVVRRFTALPIKMQGGKLLVAMPPPLDLSAVDEMKLLTGLKIKPVLATRKELTQAINEHFNITQTTKQALVEMHLQGLAKETEELVEEEFEGESSIARFVNSVIRGAIDAKASDIHLEPQRPEMRVRYRVDGVLRDVLTVPRHIESEIASRIKVMADMDISERRRPQDGHISINANSNMLDLRVSTVPTVKGEKIVMRMLDKNSMHYTYQ